MGTAGRARRAYPPRPAPEASSFKIVPGIVQFTLLGLFGPSLWPLSGFLFFWEVRGLGLLFALSGVLRWLSSSFSLFGGLLLGAALGLAAPALRLVLRRKRSTKGPPKPRSSRLRYNERPEASLMGTQDG